MRTQRGGEVASSMSLKPKRIDFECTWEQLRDTVAGVITLGKVPRPVWNDRFSYPFRTAFTSPKVYLEARLKTVSLV
ncbi:hypothetical protein HPB49_008687 [Dermacentor silvarum]|uniref:Uncharacterized protein n=1 Tax=Dermacentor silvarum TaxID=543639 RepID=A0ACB8DC37_DERSI|nr:hypothetical protein HPB49_008687 [Dermacentor silvarum]